MNDQPIYSNRKNFCDVKSEGCLMNMEQEQVGWVKGTDAFWSRAKLD